MPGAANSSSSSGDNVDAFRFLNDSGTGSGGGCQQQSTSRLKSNHQNIPRWLKCDFSFIWSANKHSTWNPFPFPLPLSKAIARSPYLALYTLASPRFFLSLSLSVCIFKLLCSTSATEMYTRCNRTQFSAAAHSFSTFFCGYTTFLP